MSEFDILNEKSFKFNKRFGQNFIFDKNLLTAIVADSKISPEDQVLEIGAGAGTLTKILASKAKKVVSFEIDKNLTEILDENLQNISNVKIIFKDALKEDIENIESNFEGEYKLVANLPYYITTPLIFKFIEETNRVKSLTIMVQKEVALRLIADNNSADYGAISVILAYYGNVKILRHVGRKMFNPPPNVDSCVVQIDIIKNKFECNEILFKNLVKLAFGNRRKTLVNNISAGLNYPKSTISDLLKELGLDENIRGEKLSVKQFVMLSNLIEKLAK